MQLIKLQRGTGKSNSASITLLPEDQEDLFAIHQIIDKDDEVIFKKMITSKVGETTKKKTDLTKLRLKIISDEFDMTDESLRYKGITVDDDTGNANIDMPVGKFFSFTVDYTYPFTIIKEEFNAYEEKVLNEACHIEQKSDTAAVVLQEGIAHVCLLTSSSTILKQKIEYTLPKKKRSTDVMKFDEKTEKFYKATYVSIKNHFDFEKLRVVILCSPGFYAKTLFEKIIKYANEEQNKTILDNKTKFLVANCSTGYLQGISEVLKNPIYSNKLEDTKYTKEVVLLDEFLEHLNNDDYKAWYGENEILKASEMGAIDTLLITDKLLRADNISERKKFLALTENVEKSGGKVVIFSMLHSSGEELDKLTGIACILKYAWPDLDEEFD